MAGYDDDGFFALVPKYTVTAEEDAEVKASKGNGSKQQVVECSDSDEDSSDTGSDSDDDSGREEGSEESDSE